MPSEPLWYCHECHAEMRPLMVPDPVCASCRGSFVEKIENPQDDPREFAHGDGGLDGGVPPNLDTFLMSLQTLMDRGMSRRRNRPEGPGLSPGFSFQFTTTSNNGARTTSFGVGPNTLGGNRRTSSPDAVPTMSEFLRGNAGGNAGNDQGDDGSRITGQMMAQYILAMLGNRDPLSALLAGGLAGMPENGRMGDYVFNQEALDQIITQIMENSNAHRPVPATEEIMNKLPREVLLAGSATLEKDCAVCKEQFKLETEDPDEHIVVTLPCKHPFHEPCIMPWLKSSGTCPVCRYALVPQPNQGPTSPSASGSPRTSPTPGPSGPSRTSPPASPTPSRPQDPPLGGLFQTLFGRVPGNQNDPSNNSGTRHMGSPPFSPQPSPWDSGFSRSPPRRPSDHQRSNSGPPSSPSNARRRNNDDRNDRLPGSWADDLD